MFRKIFKKTEPNDTIEIVNGQEYPSVPGYTFNELTFETCRPIIDTLRENNIDFIIFGGFAVFLQMIKYNEEVKDVFDVVDKTRKTEDVDILVPSVKRTMELLNENHRTSILIDKEVYERNMDARNCDLEEVGTGLKLGYKRGSDILSSIQGYSLDNIEYDTVNYKGYELKIATAKTLLSMKKELVKLYKDGARDKDLSDVGLLQLITDDRGGKAGLLW